jgi:hypothetical protein
MIKSNELRIGNLIFQKEIRNNYRDGSNSIIKSAKNIIIDYRFFEANEELNNYNYDPIPLTEEWLLRFNAEKRSDFFIFTQNDEYKSTLLLNINSEGGYKFACQHFWYGMESVHQLQNLYFALTGEELTIKQ